MGSTRSVSAVAEVELGKAGRGFPREDKGGGGRVAAPTPYIGRCIGGGSFLSPNKVQDSSLLSLEAPAPSAMPIASKLPDRLREPRFTDDGAGADAALVCTVDGSGHVERSSRLLLPLSAGVSSEPPAPLAMSILCARSVRLDSSFALEAAMARLKAEGVFFRGGGGDKWGGLLRAEKKELVEVGDVLRLQQQLQYCKCLKKNLQINLRW